VRLKNKAEAILKTIGIFVGINAFTFAFAFTWRWIAFSSLGQFLEINKPTKPNPPGGLLITLFLLQIFPLYRSHVLPK
jgi:hypothetical protein